MLNISLGASRPFEIPQLEIFCLALPPFLIVIFDSVESNFLGSVYILEHLLSICTVVVYLGPQAVLCPVF